MSALWKGITWSEGIRMTWLLMWRCVLICGISQGVFGAVLWKITEAVGMTLVVRIVFIYLAALFYTM